MRACDNSSNQEMWNGQFSQVPIFVFLNSRRELHSCCKKIYKILFGISGGHLFEGVPLGTHGRRTVEDNPFIMRYCTSEGGIIFWNRRPVQQYIQDIINSGECTGKLPIRNVLQLYYETFVKSVCGDLSINELVDGYFNPIEISIMYRAFQTIIHLLRKVMNIERI